MGIHKIEEVRVYCGPAALMAVTGKRLPEVRAVVNNIRGRAPNQGIIGMTQGEIDRSLEALGVKFNTRSIGPSPPTLRAFIETLKADVPVIINITGHFVTYYKGVVIDNHYRFGTTIDECKWAKKKVKAYWVIKSA